METLDAPKKAEAMEDGPGTCNARGRKRGIGGGASRESEEAGAVLSQKIDHEAVELEKTAKEKK